VPVYLSYFVGELIEIEQVLKGVERVEQCVLEILMI
jgi:hypothetical protein